MEMLYYWLPEVALCVSNVVYVHTMERREGFFKRVLGCAAALVLYFGIVNMFPVEASIEVRLFLRILGFCFLVFFLYFCWELSWSTSVFYVIWAFITWHLLFELWLGLRIRGRMQHFLGEEWGWIGMIFVFGIGFFVAACTIARWVPDGVPRKLGPRQLLLTMFTFFTFEVIGYTPGNVEMNPGEGEWEILFLSQMFLAVILYLQNELFKKSAMRQELAVMNLLWKKEQEQYRQSRENIALINQKCHDLKHQIRAIRNASREDVEQYLMEMEDNIQIYEAIVKTGNEVLDTILTEKSLYCRERGIVVSCVVDGGQMDFINTVDLYAILGNAMDNAIEAVEKFEHGEKRQIDVLIYRQQNFLVMNIVNPIKENLVFDEELPVSTKGDNRFHGFGLRSIRHLVKKYDGFVNITEEDGCFSLKILFPIPAK